MENYLQRRTLQQVSKENNIFLIFFNIDQLNIFQNLLLMCYKNIFNENIESLLHSKIKHGQIKMMFTLTTEM